MNTKIKKINTTAVLIFGFGLLSYVGLRILFPDFSYYIVERGGLVKSLMLKAESEKGTYLEIKPEFELAYQRLHLKLIGDFEKTEIPPMLEVFRGYAAQLNPLGATITSTEELTNLLQKDNQGINSGSLVADKEAVFFVSRGEKRPFVSQEAFLRLGYSWQAVEETAPENFERLENGEEISLASLHPDGTLFRSPEGVFLLWQNQLRPIADEELLRQVWPGAHFVRVESIEPQFLGEAEREKVSRRKAEFNFAFQEEKQLSAGYLFRLKREVFEKTEDGQAHFSTWGNLKFSTVQHSLSRIKQNLIIRYGF